MSHIGVALLTALTAVACSGDQPGTPTSSSHVDPIVGAYSLTMTVGSSCATLAPGLRHRTYAASIASSGADSYVVTLSNARFLADQQVGARTVIPHCSSWYGLGCNQFTSSREGDQLRFRLASNDERFGDEFAGHGGMIVELIPPDDSRLGISGTGPGQLVGTTIEASIDGRVWSCPAGYTSFEPDCASCGDAHVGMIFTRR